MVKTIRKILGKAREVLRSPAAVKVLAVVAGAACVGAAGATQAFAATAYVNSDSKMDEGRFGDMSRHWDDTNNRQVFCSQQGVGSSSASMDTCDLVGYTQSGYMWDGGSGWSHSGLTQGVTYSYTFTQERVTDLALIKRWADGRGDWDGDLRGAFIQDMFWTYIGLTSRGGSFTDASQVKAQLTAAHAKYTDGNQGSWGGDVDSVVSYVKENRASYTGYGVHYGRDDDNQQLIWVDSRANTGTAKLRKTSANAALTDDNPCYSLEGAVYDVYDNSACSGPAVATLTTGKDGNTDAVELAPGDYWVKERTASKGYALCSEVHKVTVAAGKESVVECAETPQNDPSLLSVQKVDSATGEAVAQGDATLAGAVFEVKYFANMDGDASGEAAATWFLRTDAKGKTTIPDAKTDPDTYFVNEFNGKASSALYLNSEGRPTIPLGTVSVREVAAPAGYTVADSSARVQVVSSTGSAETVANGVIAEGDAAVKEKVATGKVTGVKIDSARDEAVAQGDATLAGAEVTLWNRSAGSVVIGGETVEPNCAYSKTAVTDKSGNWSIEGLPYGTYEVRETKASKGYRLNEKWSQAFKVEKDGQEVELTGDAALEQDVLRGSASGVKVDSARDEAVAQGDATLAGAEVTLWNRSAESVLINGEWVEKGGKYSKTAVTDGDGNWSFGDLPYGTYEVRETKPSRGYVLNGSWSWTFEVREDGKDVTDGRKARLEQDVARGGVGVVKVDAQRDEAVPEGAATLAGAVLQIKNVSAESVYVDGVEYDPGEVIDPEKSPSAKLVTDGEGRASTSGHALPYGTYELTEKTPSKGYKLNAGWKATLEVREEGEVVWAERHEENGHLEEQVVRGDFSFDKIEGFSQSEMAGVPFLVTSRSTGESHVVVTDANGQVDTSADFTKHSQGTNASDAALSADGKSVSDESKLVCDGSAGVWFNGYADHEVEVDDSLGALPYDTYDVVELACSKNANHNLVSFTVTVTRDGVDIDKGTKEDSEVNIGTRLTYGGVEKEAPMAGSVTLTDHVMFENVRRGEHTMTAVIHAVDADGRDLGEVARATKTFTNTVTTGSVDVDVQLDTTGLGGKSVVCFEYLDLSEDGKTALARHEDIADADQTVSVPNPEISTEAAGSVEHDAAAGEGCALTDTVSYTGLTPGKRYVLVATLHERAADGSDAGAVEGAEARVVLTPKAADGEAEVRLSVDASALAGKTVVFFESLTRDEAEVASHADISDDGQSINFPKIRTHATEKESGEQVAEAKRSVTVTDAVSYENLTVGKEYKVSGTLHVKSSDGTDEGALTDADGNEVTAEKTFTAEKASGTVELEFTVDASALAGRSVVAFEHLSRDGVELASHADIADDEQTVRLPEAATTLTDADGKHETQVKADADGKRMVELTDAVAYRNLAPGRAYKVSGTLHRRAADGTDAGAIEGASATAEFEPEEPDGVVEVTFALDASALGEGESAVAFEVVSLVSEDGKSSCEVARHEDISDEAQTVGVVDLATNASGDASGTHEEQASGKVRVRDLVSYSGLTPGREYKVSGTLHVRSDDGSDTGELTDAEGDPVSAEATFTPEQSAGTVELAFTFDGSAMAGESVVAFETLSRDGVAVAVHADISDADQTVTLVSVGTEATDKATGDHTLQASEKAVVVDTVSYTGLTPGKQYTLKGELRSKTGDGGVLTGADGREVTAELTFTPEKADGSVEVELGLDSSALAGQSLVAFEYLYDGDALIAKHDDLSDEAQTVTVPTLATNATDKADGDHVVAASEKAVVVDKVSYTGLTVGKQYKVSGALHVKGEDGTDAGVLKSGGREVTAELTFTPEKADGSVELEFEFDSSALAGKTVVAFEELWRDEAKVAAHADISDADQSVTVETPETPVTPPTETTTRTYYSSPRDKATLQTGIDSLAAPVAALALAAAAVCLRARRSGE